MVLQLHFNPPYFTFDYKIVGTFIIIKKIYWLTIWNNKYWEINAWLIISYLIYMPVFTIKFRSFLFLITFFIFNSSFPYLSSNKLMETSTAVTHWDDSTSVSLVIPEIKIFFTYHLAENATLLKIHLLREWC